MKSWRQKQEDQDREEKQKFWQQLAIKSEHFLAEHPSIELMTHPSRILIIGKSQSGKTTLAVKIILYRFAQLVDNLYLFSTTADLQTTYKPLLPFLAKNRTWAFADDASFAQLWETLEKEKYKKKSLILIDDQSAETAMNVGGKGTFARFVYNNRWNNTTLMVLAHRPTAVSVAMRENLEHVVIFEQSNNRLRETVEKEFNIMDNKKDFRNLLKKTTELVPHGALHIDYKPPATLHPQFNVSSSV